MASSMKALDPAFQGVGQKAGIDIWRIENFQPVPLPESEYGKFYMGDSYIVLRTSAGKGGSFFYDIHFWIGKETSQDEAGTAAIKTVELDMVLGGRAVQHRELQGHESDKFLSYFKPCIIPLEGGVASGFRKVEKEEFETRLYVCKGKRVVRMRQVPFARSSLNHDDIFILDTEHKIYQFNGANSNIQERAKALEVIQYLKEQYHEGTCNAAVVDDGKLDTESDSGEFWVIFGGFAPLGRKVGGEDDVTPEKIPAKLYSISDGEAMPLEGELSKGMLKNSKCYLLDCGDEVFVWVGRATQLEDRKAASKVAEEFVAGQNRPKWTCTTRIIQGYETRSFRSNFDTWPAGSATPASEEGRGRVAALLKQQGMDVKGSKSNPVNEEDPTLLKEGGKTEVWYIDGSAKSPVSKGDVGKFHTGDCYIVLYTYHAGERKEDYFLCCWFGKNSKQEDQKMAVELANTVFNSLKGRPVQGRIFEGKEPPQFTALFQPMVVLKGGMSSAYKNELVEKGLTDETYNADQVALFRLSGTSVLNCKAIQVDAVATSLNSTECLVLQSGSMMFTWNGNKSSYEQQQLGAKVAGFLKPGGPIKHAKEGTESSAFWFALGGKQGYTSKRVSVEVVREPHLFTFSFDKGKFEVEEVYNFSQDDLLTEDMLILDTHAEVFVWVGQCVDIKEKQTAFEIGQKYIDMAASLDGLPPDVPLYKVPEGSEPCFFTTFFSWDHTKASVHGNSFQKKVALLFGAIHAMEEKSSGNHGGPTQRASALAALSSAFNPSSTTKSTPTAQDTSSGNPGPRQRAEALAALTSAFNSSSTTKDHPSSPSKPSGQGSQRAAAVAALSSVLTAETKKLTSDDSPDRSSDGTPVETSPRGQSVSEMATSEVEGSEEPEANKDDTEAKEEVEQENIENKIGQITFSYEQLKVHSENPVTGIDFKQREAYMGDEEFEAVLGMTKEAFYEMPKWKQDVHKKKVDLF